MTEIRPYKNDYMARRRRAVSIASLAVLAVAAAGLSIWYFRSRSGDGEGYVGKVVRISGSLSDIGLVKTFKEGESISYYTADSGFQELEYHRLQGDYAIKILARNVAAYREKMKRGFEAAAARRRAENKVEDSSTLPPPVDVVPGDEEDGTGAAAEDPDPSDAEEPVSAPDEADQGEGDDAPGYARTRESGVREYDREVSSLAAKADQVDELWQKHRDFCQGTIAVAVGNVYGREWFGIYTSILAADTPECRMMVQEMQDLAAEINAGMEAAWEKAHRAGVYPGQVRAVQQKHRMELERWNK